MSLTDSRDCRHNFSQLQLVQYRRFTSGIETDHENTHLLLGKQAGKKLGKRETHLISSPPPMLSDLNRVRDREKKAEVCAQNCAMAADRAIRSERRNAATDTEEGEEHELIQTGNRKSGRM
jgi:hypothetical protein